MYKLVKTLRTFHNSQRVEVREGGNHEATLNIAEEDGTYIGEKVCIQISQYCY